MESGEPLAVRLLERRYFNATLRPVVNGLPLLILERGRKPADPAVEHHWALHLMLKSLACRRI